MCFLCICLTNSSVLLRGIIFCISNAWLFETLNLFCRCLVEFRIQPWSRGELWFRGLHKSVIEVSAGATITSELNIAENSLPRSLKCALISLRPMQALAGDISCLSREPLLRVSPAVMLAFLGGMTPGARSELQRMTDDKSQQAQCTSISFYTLFFKVTSPYLYLIIRSHCVPPRLKKRGLKNDINTRDGTPRG